MHVQEGERRRRILFADDIELNRILVGAVLASANFNVETVSDGRAAVRALRSGTYDLVLMDLDMPGFDGFEASRAIRGMTGRAGPPIVALSSLDNRDDRAKAKAAGVDEHIGRPIAARALIIEIERVLSTIEPGRERAGTVLCEKTHADLVSLLGQDRTFTFFDLLAARLLDMKMALLSKIEIDDDILGQAHDIKASGGMLGFIEVSRCCEALEAPAHGAAPDTRLDDLAKAIDRGLAMIAVLRSPEQTLL